MKQVKLFFYEKIFLSNICANFFFTLVLLTPLLAFGFQDQGEQQDDALAVLDKVDEKEIAGRFLRPISRTAENVTVITAKEIRLLNAHTLVDILDTVPGLQTLNRTLPVSPVLTMIQGANSNQILVLIDGIPLNTLAENSADVGLIPAQIIDRVEIVKGAASSVWGQALGGVVNVITKVPESGRSATLVVSEGTNGTRDERGELSGSTKRLGYYLSGGNFQSNGLQPKLAAEVATALAKSTYQFAQDGEAVLAADFIKARRNGIFSQALDLQSRNHDERFSLNLGARKPLSEQWAIEVSGHRLHYTYGIDTRTFGNLQSQRIHSVEETTGGRIKLDWLADAPAVGVAFGLDYDRLGISQDDALNKVDLLRREVDRWGLYANGSWSPTPRLTFISGARYDVTGTSGNHASTSLGVTYNLGDNTTLRGYMSNGYSLPSFNLEQGAAQIWTSQLGVETGIIPYLWLKGTIFRNDTRHVLEYDSQTRALFYERQIRQGVELEAKTVPILHTSLSVGYTLVDAFRKPDNSSVSDVPRQTMVAGVIFEPDRWLRARLIGRYVDFNALPYHQGRYSDIIWNLFLTCTFLEGEEQHGPEIFLSFYNLTNGRQYIDDTYRNPGFWLEGGVRWLF